jgi:hypothetical protein
MTQYVAVEAATQRISLQQASVGRPDPDGYTGPPSWQPLPRAGIVYMPWQGRLAFSDAPSPWHEYMWVDGAPQWVFTGTLEQHRGLASQAVSDACRTHIERGFECAALGAPHLYPAKAQDQANLGACVTDSLLAEDEPGWTTPFWCADQAGVWEFRPHTLSQIRQVGRAGKGAIIAAMQKNDMLQQQITAASAEQLDSLTW